jgi:hypothetical protein
MENAQPHESFVMTDMGTMARNSSLPGDAGFQINTSAVGIEILTAVLLSKRECRCCRATLPVGWDFWLCPRCENEWCDVHMQNTVADD